MVMKLTFSAKFPRKYNNNENVTSCCVWKLKIRSLDLNNFSNSGDLKINTTNAFKRNKENRNLLLLNSVKWELKNFMEIAFHKLKESTAYLVFN
ncbi:hypothetical protein T01_2408 [Trichinella spiralis]|uniref:Uncharacterized protein n=1 Tax=Trichinella spiralis TaxID=6334 RepID=A0A0V1BI16_TRISP|nr:hypothetical protein T01_2408 [Trichinella spiralis]